MSYLKCCDELLFNLRHCPREFIPHNTITTLLYNIRHDRCVVKYFYAFIRVGYDPTLLVEDNFLIELKNIISCIDKYEFRTIKLKINRL